MLISTILGPLTYSSNHINFLQERNIERLKIRKKDQIKKSKEMAYFHVLIFSLLFTGLHAANIKYCDKSENYVVKVNDVKISPRPVVAGKPAKFDIFATTAQPLSTGHVVIRVTYYGVQVHTETHEICEEISCPIAAGNFLLTHTQTLPVFTPPGLYNLRITMEDSDSQQLTCISFSFKIGFGSLLFDN